MAIQNKAIVLARNPGLAVWLYGVKSGGKLRDQQSDLGHHGSTLVDALNPRGFSLPK
jgi:hypothetical protein